MERSLSPARPLRILVVEDCRDASHGTRSVPATDAAHGTRSVPATSTAAVVEGLGYPVTVCASAAEALRTAASFQPDVALVDLELPGATGYTLARSLLDQGLRRPVVLVSLSAFSADARRAHEAGFSLHLLRPIAPKELRQLLAAVDFPAG